MKVAYLTWGETPRSYGIFGSQVIGQFIANKQQTLGDQFYFISALPIIHSGFTRERFGYLEELNKIKALFGSVFIPFTIIPIYAPQNLVNSSKLTFCFMHYGSHRHLANKLKTINPDILHCRSYHATWAALAVKNSLNLSYKIIFDPRSLWPEEMALKKKWATNDNDYLFLKSLEKRLLIESDAVVSVSDPMAEHYLSLGAKKVNTIYLSASVNELGNKVKKNDRAETTLCYVGALANNTWHEPKYLMDLYIKFRDCVSNPKLIIVTTSNHEDILRELSLIPLDEITLAKSKSVSELANILCNADFGALPYRLAKPGYEEFIAKTVLATKTVEYLSAGLPVLINKQCIGAGTIITENDVGIAYDPYTLAEVNSINLVRLKNPIISERAKELATNKFDYAANGKRYIELYKSLV